MNLQFTITPKIIKQPKTKVKQKIVNQDEIAINAYSLQIGMLDRLKNTTPCNVENNIMEIYMNKFAKYLLFVLLVVFAGLIVTSGANNLGLIEMMENMNESEEKKKKK